MKWTFVLLGLMAIAFTASDHYWGPFLKEDTAPEESEDVQELAWQSTDAFLPYLNDHKNRVSDTFQVTPYYFPTVHFWFLIYTQFDSTQVVIHDRSNMSLIYKVLDFSRLHEKGLTANMLYVLQQEIAEEKVKELRADLDHLINDPFSLQPRAKALYHTFKVAGVKVPVKREQRKAFFEELKANLRSQTGQKNFIRDGLRRVQPYKTFLSRYFKSKDLPEELLAVSFLESSFNPRAHSRANALGVWQFMPFIAGHFMPKRFPYDYRSNIGVSSVAAAFLLSENYKIMKSWDLAVTAYNSGPKHLLKMKRKLGSEVGLSDIIEHSTSDHFGFASKNFYSEFLALAHTLAYRDELFPELKLAERTDNDLDLNFYMAKCTLKVNKILTEAQLEDVLFHNHHLKDPKKRLPRGLILTTKSELPSAKFMKLGDKQVLKTKPKYWQKFLTQSCSTR